MLATLAAKISQFPALDRPAIGINDRGEPEYDLTGIPAVGARDLTLAEAVDVLVLHRPGEEEPLAVQVAKSAIVEFPQLDHLLRSAAQLEIGSELRLQIPWPLWQEHAEAIVGIWLPERDAGGVDRALAIAEREYRFAKVDLESKSYIRNSLIVLATLLGRRRRDIAALTDLSIARIQQLSEDPPGEATDLIRYAVLIVGLLGKGPCPRDEIPKPRDLSEEAFEAALASLVSLGLLLKADDGYVLTHEGSALKDRGARRSASKRTTQRKRRPSSD